ncbi:MAG: peptidylprolyl isomerase [Clostridia bacterium]|nr:peptidylprolyl isomerase [Clostridia bacterium]
MICKLNRILALCVALVLALGCCAAFAEETEENPVLITLDGKEIRQDKIIELLNQLINAGYAVEGDYALAIEYAVQDQVIESKITEWGLDQFTEEEMEAFRNEAHSEWEAAIDSYVSYFLTEDTDEARAQAREDGAAYFTAYGYSEEGLAENLKMSAAYEKLEQKVLEDKDLTVSKEDIRAEFEATAAQHQAAVEGNIGLYELYKTYYGMDFWYTPEGYRSIIHILMKVDDELLTAYTEAQAAYEESKNEENPDGDAEKKAAMDAAKDAVLASKQTEIDDIYDRLSKGESFADLIAQYGEDTGMADAATLAEGYLVHADSIMYDSAFTSGAFSEKMQKPGDTSDPVIGAHGIHILYYQRDIPGGMIDLSDEISAEIEQSIYTEKVNSFYAEALEGWIAEHEVVYNQEAIDALTASAQEEEAAAE